MLPCGLLSKNPEDQSADTNVSAVVNGFEIYSYTNTVGKSLLSSTAYTCFFIYLI